jgi:mono/diheme cytochrome c family protein
VLAACGQGRGPATAEEQADSARVARMAAAEDTVRIAAEAYDPIIFDTITWPTADFAVRRGQTVWRISCMKCHGATGLGDAGFVLRGDTLRPPSFQDPDWRFATNLDSLRRYIFIGNKEGMPHWGLIPGMHSYDIDAVARFIQKDLRPARPSATAGRGPAGARAP